MTTHSLRTPLVFAALLAIAVGSRLLNLAPNFAAVTAVALFAGWFFPSRFFAAGVTLATLFISDAFLGWYDWRLMTVVYACSLIPLGLGRALATRAPRAGARAIEGGVYAALLCSAAFYLITNFAVWAFSADVAYPKTITGLLECYVNAVPFLRFTLAGDVLFTLALFGAAAALARATDRPAIQSAPTI